uniref:NmrA-like domain-containing protein n=1 Tax=Glaucocystis incrassata TaxID=1789788 RepID=A0A3G1IVH9_9EUKA|nr:hypothetical protein Ycf39 [Glaucocystis incrassata]ASQ40064.1 hypothetical protein Ycf39 [Glaucocystis incrassata]
MTILVTGATGTLGRQIVRSALDEGYQVRCLVRNLRKAAFLKEWGAKLILGDFSKPETLLPALTGIRVVIDAATARPTDSFYIVDLEGKKALINAAMAMKIEKFIFFSILFSEKYSDVPLMRIKNSTEELLKESGLNFTILKLCGFFQGLIGQYAIPILDQQAVWLTSESTPICYMDTQDIARFALRALTIPETNQQVYPLGGPRAWKSNEIIQLCERLSGQNAKVAKIPLVLLQLSRKFLRLFEWSWNIADRLAFAEILSRGEPFIPSMKNVYSTFDIEESSILSLENYFQDYFSRILKKLKEINYQQNQKKKRSI